MKKNLFRQTGVLYLLVIVSAGLSQGYVRGTLVVFGDPTATATQILAHPGLFRLGITLDLIAFILDAIISVLLYQLFQPYGKRLALISSTLRLIAHPAIGSLNLLNHYLAYHVLNGAGWLEVFDPAQLEALAMLFMEAHRYGYLIAGGFFGLHCFPLGISIYRSDAIPKLIGGLLWGSGLGYLIETFGNFQVPGYESHTAMIVGIAAAIGEVSFALYLLIKGRR